VTAAGPSARPFSSPLEKEKRAGTFTCAGCAVPLFDAAGFVAGPHSAPLITFGSIIVQKKLC